MKISSLVAFALASSFAGCALAGPVQANDPYYARSARQLAAIKAETAPPRRARNVILMIGDGMGVSTVTAARIFEGQAQGVDGESHALSFEAFPYVALAKTYAHDEQVTDSAAGATGLMAGVKTRNGVIGMDSRARFEDCASGKGADVDSIEELARRAGLAAGVVTTARVTDATPAGMFGHTPARSWEDDSSMPVAAREAGCVDLARQLVEAPAAVRLDVALGGGLSRFTTEAAGGRRTDGRDLVAAWVATTPTSRFVGNSAELKALDAAKADRLLGLFAPEHMPYRLTASAVDLDRPTLSEMSLKAIEVLKRNPRGYVLMIEGGLIDKGSHLNNAARTLTETVEFSDAVRAVTAAVNPADTLVIVTADHSHSLTISGGAERNAPILGPAEVGGKAVLAQDGQPYTILNFATGPNAGSPRTTPAVGAAFDPDYRQPALVPLESAEHGGEDVAIYATGPGSDLVRGVVEQPYVFQVMIDALGL